MRKLSRNLSIAGVAALLASPLAACNEHASSAVVTPTAASTAQATTEAVPTTSAPEPSVNTSSTADDTAKKARIRASFRALAPPKNMVWRYGSRPWTEIPASPTDVGLKEWQVKPGCHIRLWQYFGYSDSDPTTSRDIVKEIVIANSSIFPGKPKPKFRSNGTVELHTAAGSIEAIGTVRVPQSTVDYGAARSQTLAYRNGEFAIAYTSYCLTAAAFKKVSATDFDDFRDSAAASFTY
ncbi:MAG TPA: hypothetical protein VG502_02635 [Flexivirga sp.]|uniref:hypothetical protein n=1 Tax=Flexivirga sp. TaxID=1962927 RepID=UPI002BC3BD1F|nr:hypothetical protein [Flexivirga sp.]HWC21175.1 hypothetical protein [Flexivirga sp.]